MRNGNTEPALQYSRMEATMPNRGMRVVFAVSSGSALGLSFIPGISSAFFVAIFLVCMSASVVSGMAFLISEWRGVRQMSAATTPAQDHAPVPAFHG